MKSAKLRPTKVARRASGSSSNCVVFLKGFRSVCEKCRKRAKRGIEQVDVQQMLMIRGVLRPLPFALTTTRTTCIPSASRPHKGLTSLPLRLIHLHRPFRPPQTQAIMASRRSTSNSLLVLVTLILACLIHTSSAAIGVSPRLFCTVRGGAQQPSAFQRFMSVRGGMQVRVVGWWGAVWGGWGWGRSGAWRDRKGQPGVGYVCIQQATVVYNDAAALVPWWQLGRVGHHMAYPWSAV